MLKYTWLAESVYLDVTVLPSPRYSSETSEGKKKISIILGISLKEGDLNKFE